ncbi:MAG: hypothetical protein DSY80_03400 [Desulfocapsa sp.]|nr:MAG: hypothetical protein DSY80_03400 [Desulfocapsa sp.]
MPHRISYLMRNILSLLFTTVFLLSGISSLPACYATKLNCKMKNSNSCPFSSIATKKEHKNFTSCPLLAKNKAEQQSENDLPLERYKRLQIEQIQQSLPDLPSFTASFVTAFTLNSKDKYSSRFNITGESVPLNHHPPPLFIRHQSFLL